MLRHGIELLGLREQADAGPVQAGAGDQPRHPGPLRRQPAARGAAGALLAAQRELHRPRAVPERHAGGDGRAEDRLHAERRRRGRPVPLRPPPQAQGAEPPSRCCRFPSGALVHFAVSNSEVHDDDAAGRAGDTVSCPSTRATTAAAGNPVNPSGGHRTAYLWEQVWERRELAGDPRPLSGRPAGQEEADQEHHLPAVPPARRHAQAAGGGAGTKGRAAST